jgi:plasmid rolling circle replication initiator protein Rep
MFDYTTENSKASIGKAKDSGNYLRENSIEPGELDFGGLKSTGNVLVDKKKNGKDRGWAERKKLLERYAKSLYRLGLIDKAKKVSLCANVLKFLECDVCGHKKLIGAKFCHDPLCPVCMWRRALAYRAQLMRILDVATDKDKFEKMFGQERVFQDLDFISLTLTVRNVFGGSGLKKAFKEIGKGFNRLSKYKEFSGVVVGWVRSFENTRNDDKRSEWYESYHPHVHALLAVPRDLHSFHLAQLLDKFAWFKLWKKALQVDYEPSVNVHIVTPKQAGQSYHAAAVETMKYTVKSSDYLHRDNKVTDQVVEDLLEGMKGLRRVGMGGLFKEILKRLKLQDVESETADLVGAEAGKNEGMACGQCKEGVLQEVIYGWQYKDKVYTKMIIDMVTYHGGEVHFYQRL